MNNIASRIASPVTLNQLSVQLAQKITSFPLVANVSINLQFRIVIFMVLETYALFASLPLDFLTTNVRGCMMAVLFLDRVAFVASVWLELTETGMANVT